MRLVRADELNIEVDGQIPRGNRIPLEIEARLDDMLTRALGALASRPDLGLYTRGRLLVHIVQERRDAGGSSSLVPTIVPVTRTLLRERLDQAVHWERVNAKGRRHDALPPKWIVDGLFERGQWPLPHLEGLVRTPVFDRDGQIRAEPGYDLKTGLYFDAGTTTFPPVPERPTLQAAQQAWEALRAPFSEFPFVAASDESALIATVLTLLGRPGIAGPCPMTAFSAKAPGSGKSLLADGVAVLASGHVALRMAPTRDDEETRKRIVALAIEGSPLVLIDNIDGVFGSPSLAAHLTGEVLRDRLLGFSQLVSVVFRPVWIATGNNLRFRGDMARRVVLCELDAACEHPEERTGFRIPDLLGHLRQERPRLVSAALTILRGYHMAGRPPHGRPRNGSFEAWDDLIRGAVLWLGAADPLAGRERIREAGDSELEALRAALLAWHERQGTEAAALSQLLAGLGEADPLRLALAELAGCDVAQLTAIKAGHALKRVQGRVASGLRFERAARQRNGAVLWRVESGREANPRAEDA